MATRRRTARHLTRRRHNPVAVRAVAASHFDAAAREMHNVVNGLREARKHALAAETALASLRDETTMVSRAESRLRKFITLSKRGWHDIELAFDELEQAEKHNEAAE